MPWPDSDLLRTVGYVVVGVLMLLAARWERRRRPAPAGAWPTFWVMTGVFVLTMGLGRALEAGDVLSALGRDAAAGRGWYDSRRPAQAAAVGAVGLAWAITVGIALWRTPERRRRFLPIGVLVVTLAAFAGIRVVSLHQVDTLLYDTRIGAVRVGTLVEAALLALTALATLGRTIVGRGSERAGSLQIERP